MPELIINAREAAISKKLSVHRILPFRKKRMVGPFIFMDHAGPMEMRASDFATMDVLPHPHIGLSTVTYLLNGKVTHRDSLGVEQVIIPGEVNWMTAGKGIAHSERFEDPELLEKHGLEMIQTWVALPTEIEECDPTFQNYKPDHLKTYTDKGVWIRLIAGSAYGLKSSVQVHSPLFYVHVHLDAGSAIDLPKGYAERGAYVADGRIELGGKSYHKGQMIVFSKKEEAALLAAEESTVMLLGGEPLGERFIWWNFVASSKERIEQAKNDWKTGKIVLPPTDNKVFIPLPEEKFGPVSSKVPPPEPLS